MFRQLLTLLTMVFICVLVLPLQSQAQSSYEKKLQKKVQQSQQAIWVAHILRQRPKEKKIEGLEFKGEKIPVFLLPHKDSFRPLVKIKPRFQQEGWKLYVGKNTPAKPSGEEGEYVVYAYLNSRISEIQFLARNENGETRREKVYIFAPEARQFKQVSAFKSVSYNIGFSKLFYEQTTFGVFTASSLVLGLSYLTPEKGSKWGMIGDFDITVMTLDSEPIDHNPQFYEGLIAGTYQYKIFKKDPRWRSRLIAGIGTSGLISHGSPFGYSGLAGIDLGVRSEYFKNRTESYIIEGHYMTYDGISLTQDRAFSIEGKWRFNHENLRQTVVGLRMVTHKFQVSFEEIEVDFISLSGSFTF